MILQYELGSPAGLTTSLMWLHSAERSTVGPAQLDSETVGITLPTSVSAPPECKRRVCLASLWLRPGTSTNVTCSIFY